jgi:menaquinone-specific isochorismate synthase
VLDLAAALHPTAAVAGTPTNLAKELILQLEQNDRGRYAGPIGWIGADGDGEWAIALRGAQIANGTLRAFAGCGIVAESEPEAELTETDLKFRPIREALS